MELYNSETIYLLPHIFCHTYTYTYIYSLEYQLPNSQKAQRKFKHFVVKNSKTLIRILTCFGFTQNFNFIWKISNKQHTNKVQ